MSQSSSNQRYLIKRIGRYISQLCDIRLAFERHHEINDWWRSDLDIHLQNIIDNSCNSRYQEQRNGLTDCYFVKFDDYLIDAFCNEFEHYKFTYKEVKSIVHTITNTTIQDTHVSKMQLKEFIVICMKKILGSKKFHTYLSSDEIVLSLTTDTVERTQANSYGLDTTQVVTIPTREKIKRIVSSEAPNYEVSKTIYPNHFATPTILTQNDMYGISESLAADIASAQARLAMAKDIT